MITQIGITKILRGFLSVVRAYEERGFPKSVKTEEDTKKDNDTEQNIG